MFSFNFLTVALLATTAASSPILEQRSTEILETRARANCTEFASVSAGSVCIDRPSDCSATYLVKAGDTCTSIGNLFGNFTLTEFFYWNPDVTQTCLALQAFVPVCINTPWYTFTPPVQASTGAIVSASAIPVPIMPLITANCTTFEFVGDGLTVDQIVASNGITEAEFFDWNQDVSSSDPVLWAEYWVCVGA